MTSRAHRHLSRVASLSCVLCGSKPVQVHHLREGQGMSQRASDFLTVALCPECHQGANGLHGNRSLLRIRHLEELDLLALTIEALE